MPGANLTYTHEGGLGDAGSESPVTLPSAEPADAGPDGTADGDARRRERSTERRNAEAHNFRSVSQRNDTPSGGATVRGGGPGRKKRSPPVRSRYSIHNSAAQTVRYRCAWAAVEPVQTTLAALPARSRIHNAQSPERVSHIQKLKRHSETETSLAQLPT